jgi:hypothetical protein
MAGDKKRRGDPIPHLSHAKEHISKIFECLISTRDEHLFWTTVNNR